MICLGTAFFLLVSVEVLLQGYSPWTLSVQIASPVLLITHVLSGLPDVLITQLPDCWNIWAYTRPLPLLYLYFCPSKRPQSKTRL